MISKSLIISMIGIVHYSFCNAQIGSTIPLANRADYSDPGVENGIPSTYTFNIDAVVDLGMDATGNSDNSSILQGYINGNTQLPGSSSPRSGLVRIFFGPGTYKFTSTINVSNVGPNRGSILFQGAGSDYTHFVFENSTGALFYVYGVSDNPVSSKYLYGGVTKSSYQFESPGIFPNNTWVQIQTPFNDNYLKSSICQTPQYLNCIDSPSSCLTYSGFPFQ